MKTMKRAAVHGPLIYQGLNIPDYYISQGIAHTMILIDFGFSKRDSTRKLPQMSTQDMLLEIGSGHQLVNHGYDIMHTMATHRWMNNTCEYMYKYEIGLDTTLLKLKLACPGDMFIMAEFIRRKIPNLERLNQI